MCPCALRGHETSRMKWLILLEQNTDVKGSELIPNVSSHVEKLSEATALLKESGQRTRPAHPRSSVFFLLHSLLMFQILPQWRRTIVAQNSFSSVGGAVQLGW